MKTLATLLIALLLTGCAGSRFAQAQQAVVTLPYKDAMTTNVSGTVAVTNTFQSVFAPVGPAATAQSLDSNKKRSACTIQNNGTHTMYVFFGPVASATTSNSVQLAAGQPVSCNVGGLALQDQVSITGTSGDTFYAAQQ